MGVHVSVSTQMEFLVRMREPVTHSRVACEAFTCNVGDLRFKYMLFLSQTRGLNLSVPHDNCPDCKAINYFWIENLACWSHFTSY